MWDPQKFGILDAGASRNYLSLVCQPLGDKEIYMITNVYGPQKQEDKLKLLTSLEELRARHPNIPWIVAGDFIMMFWKAMESLPSYLIPPFFSVRDLIIFKYPTMIQGILGCLALSFSMEVRSLSFSSCFRGP